MEHWIISDSDHLGGKARVRGTRISVAFLLECLASGRSGKLQWRGGFRAVKNLWQDSAVELLKMTKTASDELGRNPNAIGKSRNHWANLFARVAMRDLMKGKQ